MVVAYAGRRAETLGADHDAVVLRIRRLLAALKPTAVVGAASDGGDLLVAEIALGMPDGPHVALVLPTPEDVFREQSVAPDWRARFDRVLGEARERGSVETLGLPDGEDAYRRANTAYLDRAAELLAPGERVVALVVAAEGEGAMVEDLAATARLRDVPVLRIDPQAELTTRCFVAMPYGRKLDPQRKLEVDCDEVYSKILVPALEDAQLRYRRADEEIDAGVILQPMIEWLAEADIVIGDLQTGNFNVGWELGLRHLMRRSGTLLVRPLGTIPPFDLNTLRHVGYEQGSSGVSDDAAIAAWRALGPYLTRDGSGLRAPDSPVDAVMDVVSWGRVERPADAPDARWEELRQRLALARDLGDADLMLEVVRSDAAQLEPEHVALLQAEAGVGLVRLGRFDEARELLEPVVAEDPQVQRPDAHVYLAQALYRPKDASFDALGRAEKTLGRVLVARPAHPEVRALLGAIAKRRARLQQDEGARREDLGRALAFYRHDYERNLNAYYEGINVIAVAVVLFAHDGDEDAGREARRLLPVVRVAAQLAATASPADYWPAATLAECALHEAVLGAGAPDVDEAFAAAGRLRPGDGDLGSTLAQLDFLRALGLPPEPLATAEAGLLRGAGRAARP